MRKKPSRIWRAFESPAGLARSGAEWRRILGPEFDSLRPYLRARQKQATSVPCPAKRSCGCYHGVVSHGHEDLVAVCRCEDRRCPTAPVSRADVVVYEVHTGGLGAAIAAAFGAKAEGQALGTIHGAWQVGTYAPRPGVRLALYLAMYGDPKDFKQTVTTLAASDAGPFVLLAPTESAWTPEHHGLFRSRKARFLALADTLDWNGKITAGQSLEMLLPDLFEEIAPPADQYELRKEGATWRAVYRGEAKSVPDSKGVAYLATLLSMPNKEVHCTQFYEGAPIPAAQVSLVQERSETDEAANQQLPTTGSRTHVDADLDQEGISSYNRRLKAIPEEIEEARELGQTEKAALLAQEEHTITQALARSVYKGKPRREGPTKRARQAVSKAIKSAMKTIKTAHPALHQHLHGAIQFGEFLQYRADDGARWLVSK